MNPTDVNPARAGMIRGRATQERVCARKPRASGDDPAKSSLYGA